MDRARNCRVMTAAPHAAQTVAPRSSLQYRVAICNVAAEPFPIRIEAAMSGISAVVDCFLGTSIRRDQQVFAASRVPRIARRSQSISNERYHARPTSTEWTHGEGADSSAPSGARSCMNPAALRRCGYRRKQSPFTNHTACGSRSGPFVIDPRHDAGSSIGATKTSCDSPESAPWATTGASSVAKRVTIQKSSVLSVSPLDVHPSGPTKAINEGGSKRPIMEWIGFWPARQTQDG